MELKEQLEEFAYKMEGKSKNEVKNAIVEFEAKQKDFIAEEIKAGNKSIKGEFEAEIKKVKEHADALDMKLQEAKKVEISNKDEIKSILNENFDRISQVRKGNAVEVKANMTLGDSLTGDQPRDYSFNTVMDASQKINVSDLIGSVSISGGTYTFPRETGSNGGFAYQVEGSSKAQIDYTLEMVDVNTDFLAGYSRYSRKMKNNLPFLESFLPKALRRDYAKAENADFYTKISGAATTSNVDAGNKIERLIADIAVLENTNFDVNGVVVNVSDWWDIQVTEASTGAGYGLPGVVTYDGGVLRINGIPIYKATWIPADKYLVGDWSRVNKVVTEGLSLEFSDVEGTNFVANNITARLEAQVNVAVEQPDAIIFGDFTAV